MALQQVVQLLQAAIEASVYVAPTEVGLTVAELYEVGERLGLKEGEIGDAIPQVSTQYFGRPNHRMLLPEHFWHHSGFLIFSEEPDLRNPISFDFVYSQLNELVREMGAGRARIDRNILIERAQAHSIDRHDIDVAIMLMLLSGQLVEEADGLRFKSAQGGVKPLPSASMNQPGAGRPMFRKDLRTRVMPHVRDVIERRGDGRPRSVEPFPAFAEQLDKLGYGQFRMWWNQTEGELGRTNPISSPLSALVLSAALVEGSLTFVVRHAQKLGLGVFGSTDFAKDPRTWRIDDLVASAARGGDTAILDNQTKVRAEGLVYTRQRIHAGRLLSEFSKGVPDLRPEEARDAKAVAEQVVRRVLDWLNRYPPG